MTQVKIVSGSRLDRLRAERRQGSSRRGSFRVRPPAGSDVSPASKSHLERQECRATRPCHARLPVSPRRQASGHAR